jgi:hypothetical protein
MLKSAEYLCWQISMERQRHEWMRTRRKIVGARIRIVIYGHLLLLIAALITQGVGGLGLMLNVASAAAFSLLFISAFLFLTEFLHVKMLPKTPPKFVVRPSGVTEYDEEGPRMHWDWSRTRMLSIETDVQQPRYRTLVLKMSETVWLGKLGRVCIPLPEVSAAESAPDATGKVDEREVVAAIAQALQENGIRWHARGDGTLALVREK